MPRSCALTVKVETDALGAAEMVSVLRLEHIQSCAVVKRANGRLQLEVHHSKLIGAYFARQSLFISSVTMTPSFDQSNAIEPPS